ncbi:MAG TPA: UDP-N-acetylmuramate dehydrogenase [Veillonellaceae bacterium]|nr:UDP-N-acetylmuramate dehydrogenase [Veillonellaceae bacterium]
MNLNDANLFSGVLGENQIKVNEPMSRHTTFGIGGPADFFLLPETTEELCIITKLVRKNNLPLFILGGGANLLVRDKGIRGVVICTSRLQGIEKIGNMLKVSSGIPTAAVARKALSYGLSGMEFASGIPGSIGGAAFMNAGAYGGEMSKIISQATVCDTSGDLVVYDKKDLGYSYRQSRFMQKGEVIVDITLSLKEGNENDIKALMDDLNGRRRSKQPLDKKSAGSTFKRPEGHFVGQMIEELGLKGFSVGDAQVSEMHAGFLINNGNASCEDMLQLIHVVQGKVKEAYGVDLHTEVQIVGEE